MRNKRKEIVLAASILGSIAIVSTGFASWVISAPASAQANGNVAVETVADNRLVASVDTVAGYDTVKFGYKADSSVTNPWLTTTEGTITEQLVFKTKITVSRKGDSSKVSTLTRSSFTAAFELNDPASKYATCVTNNYIVTPEASSFAFDDAGKAEGVYVLSWTWNWGSAFKVNDGDANGSNPYTYFNKQTYTETLGNKAYDALTAISEITATFKFTVNIKE